MWGIRALADFIKRHRNHNVLLALHSQADVDTLASALALNEYFTKGTICVPDMLGSQAKRINERFNGQVVKFKDAPLGNSAIMVLDSNSYSMLEGMADYVRSFKGEIAVVDHHSIHTDAVAAAHSLIDNSASSTCEMVYSLFKTLNFPISSRCAELLLIGIIHDSADFRNATTHTLEIVTYLLKRTKLALPSLFALAAEQDDAAKRIGVLKAVSRAKVYRAGNFIFASSTASSFEASAASTLISLGADYAFVAQETHHEIRISARCRPELVEERGADVAEIMSSIGRLIGGTGGGHAAAAGANGPRRELLEDALARCVELARGQMRASLLEKLSTS